MPIWAKCILMLWVVRYVMKLFIQAHADEFATKLARAQVTKKYTGLPWYIYVYGATIIVCRLSIILLAAWLIFFIG